ncbi:hypothetical protein EGW08_022295 [Elysia chlorotica]|uniref:CCHC-type domain-containing protein n=1 Tax=Elysia chlorotica TaxID=188477 RepID=A0A3S1BLK5_ELYCH|nr:hypothetical protein EGW08_022295 [Elysia chlorotica]
MSSIQEIKELAEELQLRGDEKRKFIIEQMDKLRQLQAEKEEREAKLLREEREAKLQAEKELKMEEMRTQLELARIQAQASQQSEHNLTSGSTRSVHDEGEHSKFKMPKLPAFVDRKDDLDSWLLRFERFATTSGWPKESWCTPLSALLTGRALEAFCRLSETEATDYDRVKEVLQKRYNLTEDGYRQRFRTGSPEEGENPSMFIVRLKTYLERWMKLAEAPQTYEALRDLFVKEQFLDSSPADLSTYLRERRLADLEEVARSAELFLTARKRQLSDRARQGITREQNRPSSSKEEEIICHICRKPGHSTRNCRNKATHGRGCYHCGELTHVRKDCPKLRMNNSKKEGDNEIDPYVYRTKIKTADANTFPRMLKLNFRGNPRFRGQFPSHLTHVLPSLRLSTIPTPKSPVLSSSLCFLLLCQEHLLLTAREGDT